MAIEKTSSPNAPVAEVPADTAPAPVVAAPAAGERKGKQLSATVTPEFFAAFTDLKWDLRKDVPAMLREAAEDYLSKHKSAK